METATVDHQPTLFCEKMFKRQTLNLGLSIVQKLDCSDFSGYQIRRLRPSIVAMFYALHSIVGFQFDVICFNSDD